MENRTNSLENLFEKAGDYLETRVELLKLQAVNTSSDVTSSLLAGIMMVFMGSIIFLLLNIGIAVWLGDVLGKMYYGFFMVSGFYIVLVLLFFLFRKKWIKKPLNDLLVKKMLN